MWFGKISRRRLAPLCDAPRQKYTIPESQAALAPDAVSFPGITYEAEGF